MTDMHSKKEENTLEHPNASRIEFDDMLGDVFGMNLRGLRSLYVSIFRPKEYADAARSKDWQVGRYTPSFRIWFTIMALFGLSSIFFTNEIFSSFESFGEGLDDTTPLLGLGDQILTEAELRRSHVVFTFTYFGLAFIPFLLINAAVFRMFPYPTTYVLRFRLITAMVLPLFTFFVLSTLSNLLPYTYKDNKSILDTFFGIAFVLALLTTGYFGALSEHLPVRRVISTLLFFVTISVSVFLCLLVTIFFGYFIVEGGAYPRVFSSGQPSAVISEPP